MCWWKESSEFALVHFDHMMNVSVVVINDEKCVGCMRTATLLQLDCAKSRKKDLGTDAGSEEKRWNKRVTELSIIRWFDSNASFT